MASAASPQPHPAFAPNNACPEVVTLDDTDYSYLVEVLRLDGGKSESDLDDEVMAKASALGIDTTDTSSSAAAERGPTSSPPDSFPGCRSRSLLAQSSSKATTASSITSHSFTFDAFPTTSWTKRSSDPPRFSETLDFSLYDKYLSQLGPNITQPKLVKALAVTVAGEPRPIRFGFPKTGSIANFRNGFKTRMLWGRKPSDVTT